VQPVISLNVLGKDQQAIGGSDVVLVCDGLGIDKDTFGADGTGLRIIAWRSKGATNRTPNSIL
jgi:hypothetical protein